MTSPAVTELPRRLEPISRDTFLDELAIAAQRSDREMKLASSALRRDEVARDPHPAPSRVESPARPGAAGPA